MFTMITIIVITLKTMMMMMMIMTAVMIKVNCRFAPQASGADSAYWH